MADYLIQDTTLKEIADAIRSQTGGTDEIAVSDMAAIIEGLTATYDYENTDVTRINPYAYQNMSLMKSASFPNATYIGGYAFYGCESLVSCNIPAMTDTTLPSYLFYKCKSLKEVTFPSIVTSIYDYCFYECTSLEAVNLSAVTHLQNYVFYKCTSLKSIDLPKGSSLGKYTLAECSSLQTIKLGGSILSYQGFDPYCCANCRNLTALLLPNATTAPVINSTSFLNTPIASGTGFIYVPDNLVETFKTDEDWIATTYANQIKPISEYTE